MEKKATKIKKLRLTSVDMVRRGANPDAHINLYKSADGEPVDKPEDANSSIVKAIVDGLKSALGISEETVEEAGGVEKKADTFDEKVRLREMMDNRWKYQDVLNMSIESILEDKDMSEQDKKTMVKDSIDQFARAYTEVCEVLIEAKEGRPTNVNALAIGKSEEVDIEENFAKSEDDDDVFDIEAVMPEETVEKKEEEGDQEMRIDKSRFTDEELEMYNGLIAKGMVEDEEEEYVPAPAPKKKAVEKEEEVDEGVTKALNDALAEMAELKKSMEMKELTNIAKKYAVLGKKEDELAETLYAMKKSGQDVYDSYIAVLDESAEMVEKSGMFSEIGKSSRSMAGGDTQSKIESIATEIQKADPSMDRVEAIAKAWEQHPELVAEYESNY